METLCRFARVAPITFFMPGAPTAYAAFAAQHAHAHLGRCPGGEHCRTLNGHRCCVYDPGFDQARTQVCVMVQVYGAHVQLQGTEYNMSALCMQAVAINLYPGAVCSTYPTTGPYVAVFLAATQRGHSISQFQSLH